MKKTFAIILACALLCILFSGCKQEEAIPACSHQFAAVVIKDAACGTAGSMKQTCSICGFSVPQVLPELSHDFTETVAKEATCAEEGIRKITCSLCGDEEEHSIPALAHSFDFYTLTPDLCTVCGQTVEGAAADPKGQWYGKNWVALGTSLTAEEKGTYVKPLAARTGLIPTNLGVPGGTASAHILQAAETAELSQADLITVEFGVNDWAENCPLGEVGDTTPYLAELEGWNNEGSEDGTFAGSCYQVFTTLQKRAPQAVVVFLTDPTGQEYSDDAGNCSRKTRNYYELRQWDYTEMAMAVARYTGIRVIDAGSASMINQNHPQYLADQIHHTELGGHQYALTVWAELKDMAPLLKTE